MEIGRPSHHFVRIKDYIENKIMILRELGIYLTKEQKEHMLSLKSEISVDNYARSLIIKEDD